jgi:hypothetical protein
MRVFVYGEDGCGGCDADGAAEDADEGYDALGYGWRGGVSGQEGKRGTGTYYYPSTDTPNSPQYSSY